jgi:hypothetical protein
MSRGDALGREGRDVPSKSPVSETTTVPVCLSWSSEVVIVLVVFVFVDVGVEEEERAMSRSALDERLLVPTPGAESAPRSPGGPGRARPLPTRQS